MTSLAVNQIFSRQANPRPPWAGNTLIPQFGLVSSRTFIIYMSWLIENFYHLHVMAHQELLSFTCHGSSRTFIIYMTQNSSSWSLYFIQTNPFRCEANFVWMHTIISRYVAVQL